MRRKREDVAEQLRLSDTNFLKLPSASHGKPQHSAATNTTSVHSSVSSSSGHVHDWYLHGEDESSLHRYFKSDLLSLCKARGLPAEGTTKNDMIAALLHWRKHALPPGADQDEFVSKLSARYRESPSMPNLQSLQLSTGNIRMRMASYDHVSHEEKSGVASEAGRMKVGFHASSDSAYKSATVAISDCNEEGTIPFEELDIGKKVASGGFKDVYRGRYRDQEVAIADIKLGDEDWEDLENELHVLKQLHHDCIVRFLGIAKQYGDPAEALKGKGKGKRSGNNSSATTSPATVVDTLNRVVTKFCLVTDFCNHGDLSDYMRNNPKPSLQKQLTFMYDIAFGCVYLHGRRPAIIHRDLKSVNILIGNDLRAKISDFGLAKIKTKARLMMHTVVGTPNWQAPEMWCDKPNYTEKVDVYSCALIFWEILMWSNQFPFGDLTDFQIYEQVGKKDLRPSLTGLKRYPKELLELMEEMWDKDPDVRPGMSEVVQRLSELMK